MKFTHPAFFYHLLFKVTRPGIQQLISEIESNVLVWHGLHSATHAMGGKAFLFHRSEIGHIHWNGDLDIMFGRPITSELLKLDKIQQHKFVPASAITFSVLKSENIPFAISLLLLSYLRILRNRNESFSEIETYTAKLPDALRRIL